MARALRDEKLPEVPKLPAPVSLGDIALTEQCRWLENLPQGEVRENFQTMEDLGQTTGMIAYRTTVEGPLEGELALGTVKDRVQVLLDGKLLGISGRSTQQPSVSVKIPAGKHRLDLVVENMGRINYGGTMAEERKGLTGKVVLGGKTLGPFEQVGLPLQDPPGGKFEKIEDGAMLAGPAVYRAKFKLGTTGDTWLDLRGFGRGMVWFNGRNLGRYWKIGPTEGIFLPGCWMKAGEENELVILELEVTKPPKRVRTSARAIWGSEVKR